VHEAILAAIYLALLPIGVPQLPGNSRPIDWLFPVFGALVIGRGWRTWRPGSLDYGVLAFLLLLLPSFAATDDVRSSGLEFLKYLYLASVYVVFAMYFARTGLAFGAGIIVRAAAVLCLGGLIVVIFCYATGRTAWPVVSANSLPYLGLVPRLWGGADSPEMFGNYLTFVLPLAFAGGIARLWPRGSSIAMVAVIVLAMGFTIAHAVSGFLVAGLVLLWPVLRSRPWPVRAAALTVVLVTCLLVNLTLVVMVRRVDWHTGRDAAVPAPSKYALQDAAGARRLTLELTYNPMNYYLLKRVAFDAFLDRPLTGVGLGRFSAVSTRAHADARLHAPEGPLDPHSTVAGALAEGGLPAGIAVVGLLAFALLVPVPVQTSADYWMVRGARAAVAGLAINGLNADILHFRFMWIALALLRARTGRGAVSGPAVDRTR
jgi:hypothetical protein